LNPLGFVEKADGELDAIVSIDDEVFVVRQGETFGGHFRAVRVSRDAVEIAEVSPNIGLDLFAPQFWTTRYTLAIDANGESSLSLFNGLGLDPGGCCAAGDADVPVERIDLTTSSPPVSVKKQPSQRKPVVKQRQPGKSGEGRNSPDGDKSSEVPGLVLFPVLGSVETSSGEVEAIVAEGSGVYLVKPGQPFGDGYRAISVGPGVVVAARAGPLPDYLGLMSTQTDARAKSASNNLDSIKGSLQSSAVNPQGLPRTACPGANCLASLGVNLFDSPGFIGYDLQSHLALADNSNTEF
jgi:hypothetical protein